jgi:hypothetical protein
VKEYIILLLHFHYSTVQHSSMHVLIYKSSWNFFYIHKNITLRLVPVSLMLYTFTVCKPYIRGHVETFLTIRLTLLPYYHTTLLPYYLTTLLPYYLTTLLPYYLTTLLPYYLTTLLPYYLTAVHEQTWRLRQGAFFLFFEHCRINLH